MSTSRIDRLRIAFPFALSAVLLSGIAQGEQKELNVAFESEVFGQRGEVTLTQAELDAYLARIPEEDRAGVLSSPERVERILDDLFLTRLVARDGIEQGLLGETEVHAHLYQVAMVYLAERQLQRLQDDAELDDYTNQARDLYLRNPESYRREERADFTHLLITAEDRSEGEAEELIAELAQRAAGGESLDSLIRDYSEDPSASRNRGRFTDTEFDRLDQDFAAALRRLKPGQVSEPVRTQFGWHLIRLDRHQPAGVPEFEEVADALRERARRRHREEVRERYMRRLMSEPLVIEPGAVEKLLNRYDASFDRARGPDAPEQQ